MNIRDVYMLILQQGDEVFNELTYPFTVSYDDGVTTDVSFSILYYDFYMFKSFMLKYPKLPIVSKYSVKYNGMAENYNTSTHIQILDTIVKDLDNNGHVNFFVHEEKVGVYKTIIAAIETLYNALTKHSTKYSLTIDITDFIEIDQIPEVRKAIEIKSITTDGVYKAYEAFFSAIKENKKNLSHNMVMKFIDAKVVNTNQLAQCMVLRGFVSEVDGSILPIPVLGNYLRGNTSAYDFVAESRTAAKALYFSEAPLQDAEYFARRLQLLTTVVERVDSEHIVDCGTNEYLLWNIKPEEIDESGRVTYPGDFKFLIGKYYLDEATNTLKEITPNDKHLIGKVIKMRSVLHCKHPDKQAICATCFGALHKNIARTANIGHVCSATMTRQTSQSVLGTKHISTSSLTTRVLLSDRASNYMFTDKSNNIYLRKEYRKVLVSVVIDRDSASSLLDIFTLDNINNINPRRISNIVNMELKLKRQSDLVNIPFQVAKYTKTFMLSFEFLKYIKEKGFKVDAINNFEIDLADWDYSKPILRTPEREYSYSEHSKQISKVIENTVARAMDEDNISPTAILQELFMLVNTKLNVNIANLEVIVYAASIYSEDNYDLSRHSEAPILGKASKILKMRSMSAAYAYQGHSKTMTSATSFNPANRPHHVMDIFITPQQVINYYRRKKL